MRQDEKRLKYLVREVWRTLRLTPSWEEEEEAAEEGTVLEGDGPEVIRVELNVCYSESYQAPVMYFRGVHSCT